MMKFKAGDKVKVVENITGHAFDIGEIVTITRPLPDAKIPHYETNDIWVITDEEVEEVQ